MDSPYSEKYFHCNLKTSDYDRRGFGSALCKFAKKYVACVCCLYLLRSSRV